MFICAIFGIWLLRSLVSRSLPLCLFVGPLGLLLGPGWLVAARRTAAWGAPPLRPRRGVSQTARTPRARALPPRLLAGGEAKVPHPSRTPHHGPRGPTVQPLGELLFGQPRVPTSKRLRR